MRHRLKGKKLNRTSAHRRALLSNMAVSLLQHEQIKTTLPKAKALRPVVERLITSGCRGGLHRFRSILSFLQDKKMTRKVMGEMAARYQNRPGGYTRILKTGFRYGDHAPMAIIEFVDKPHVPSSDSSKPVS